MAGFLSGLTANASASSFGHEKPRQDAAFRAARKIGLR
jgi:hypothetical protein